MTKRNIIKIIALAILAMLVIIVITMNTMNMVGDTDPVEVRPVSEGSVKAPGSGIKIGNTQ